MKINMALESLVSLVEKFGLSLSILAWFSVFFTVIVLGIVLKKSSLSKVWIPALVVGCFSLVAHLIDYYLTLGINPTLTQEANPIWRIVIDNFGLEIAKAYGFTGKLLLAVLSFEFFAYYLIQSQKLFPQQADNFFSFWREFGVSQGKKEFIRWPNVINIFSFIFALIGPFCFYIALLNHMVDNPLYMRLPPLLFALTIYTLVLVVVYLVVTYRAFRHLHK